MSSDSTDSTIPQRHTFMRPITELVGDGAVRSKRDMDWAEKMRDLQSQARDELGGRIVSREEVTALVKKTLRASAND